jgi:hypothetical protein
MICGLGARDPYFRVLPAFDAQDRETAHRKASRGDVERNRYAPKPKPLKTKRQAAWRDHADASDAKCASPPHRITQCKTTAPAAEALSRR